MTRTGSVVTLEVAKQGAIYHGLATLLNQPSPMMQRGKPANIIYVGDSFISLRMQKIEDFTVACQTTKILNWKRNIIAQKRSISFLIKTSSFFKYGLRLW